MKFLYKGRLKSSKPHPERKAKAEHFCCGNTITSDKTRKVISGFPLNFGAGETITKVCDKSKKEQNIDSSSHKILVEGACVVMVNVIGNGHGDRSSNPGRD